MKKILLLLMSFLLIASIAGTAMAGSEVDVSDSEVEIDTDTQAPVAVDVTITAYDANKPSQSYVVGVEADPGLEVYMISADPLGYLDISPNVYVTSGFSEVFTSSSINQEHKGKLYIRGTNEGDVTVSVYKASVTGNTFIVGKIVSVASVTATPIPEFPTVALPVAGILGLLFVFGRKKEEM